jgi:L,D-peptidoglycan transpeptidase YkuD (ErfK/YbiS/YcfS/YnhG family)
VADTPVADTPVADTAVADTAVADNAVAAAAASTTPASAPRLHTPIAITLHHGHGQALLPGFSPSDARPARQVDRPSRRPGSEAAIEPVTVWQMLMRSCWRLLVVALVIVLGLGSASAQGRAATRAGAAGQLIRVTARSHSATTARLAAYRRSGRRWVRVFGPWTARVGYNGIARHGAKREGDGRTPSGNFGFGFFFGVRRDPGVAFRYRRARSYDVWDDDPASPLYNEWVDTRRRDPGANPEPMDRRPAYDYGAVIAYNRARIPGRGSAIFLHVGTGTATAGCVSLPERELLALLRWLRPGRSPRIVISVAPAGG